MVKTKCEIYSRVVGYLRPVQQWNEGKKAEWNDRETFEEANKKTTDKVTKMSGQQQKQPAKVAA